MILTATEEHIARAASAILSGRLVAFPTETVYGLGGSALSEKAIGAIYEAKGRPATNPLIVHCSSLEMLGRVVTKDPSPRIGGLLSKLSELWPGPLSVILPAAEHLPTAVTA